MSSRSRTVFRLQGPPSRLRPTGRPTVGRSSGTCHSLRMYIERCRESVCFFIIKPADGYLHGARLNNVISIAHVFRLQRPTLVPVGRPNGRCPLRMSTERCGERSVFATTCDYSTTPISSAPSPERERAGKSGPSSVCRHSRLTAAAVGRLCVTVGRLGRRTHLTVGTLGPAAVDCHGRLRGRARTPYFFSSGQHAQCLLDNQPVTKLVYL